MSGKFKMLATSEGIMIDPSSYLPVGGNYKEKCKEYRVVMLLPNNEKPLYGIMECKCPKIMDDGRVKFYPARIQYNIINDSVSTKEDGRLYIG